MKTSTIADDFRSFAARFQGIIDQLGNLASDLRDYASRIEGARNLCDACGMHAESERSTTWVSDLERRIEHLTEERDHYLEELENMRSGKKHVDI